MSIFKTFKGICILLFLCATMHSNKVYSQTYNSHTTTGQLARSITSGHASEEAKVKALFVWIANTISYDHELQNSRKLQKEIYTTEENVIKHVLKRKKALCGGYAFLFTELCTRLGIESKVIHGFSKKYTPGAYKNKQVDHSWNAVKINGKWELLDINWAVSMKEGEKISMYWYLTNPEHFIYSHFPADPKWTLLDRKVSREEFYGLK